MRRENYAEEGKVFRLRFVKRKDRFPGKEKSVFKQNERVFAIPKRRLFLYLLDEEVVKLYRIHKIGGATAHVMKALKGFFVRFQNDGRFNI